MATKKKTSAADEEITEAKEAEAGAVPDTVTEKAPEEAAKKEKKFQLENLRKNCRQLFGVSSCTFAGATAGMTGEYSVDEMKNIINEWCGKGAK